MSNHTHSTVYVYFTNHKLSLDTFGIIIKNTIWTYHIIKYIWKINQKYYLERLLYVLTLHE